MVSENRKWEPTYEIISDHPKFRIGYGKFEERQLLELDVATWLEEMRENAPMSES